MIAACSSNSGKTTAALGLVCLLRKMGLSVSAAKCGPDYIDRTWLNWATEKPAANLDLRMTDRDGLTAILERIFHQSGDLLIVEGAMGFFDGDDKGMASSAQIAAFLKIPVILLLNARGMAHSLLALLQGFLDYQADWMSEYGKPHVIGVICTHVSGSRHGQYCQKILEPFLKSRGLDFFGCLPSQNLPSIPSRHLGLMNPEETGLTREHLANWFDNSCSVNKIIKALNYTPSPASKITRAERQAFFPALKKIPSAIKIAIAHDQAFYFCYADLPALLEEMGAKPVFFSPLNDRSLPECDALYLPGGYPELFLDRLSQNKSMMDSIRKKASSDLPIYGECGGYIYLGQGIRDLNGRMYEMCALLPPHFELTKNLQALGYRELQAAASDFLPPDIGILKGHEFHYTKIASCKDDRRLWKYTGRDCETVFDGYINGCVMGAFTHLFPEGSKNFWRFWIRMIKEKIIPDGTGQGKDTFGN